MTPLERADRVLAIVCVIAAVAAVLVLFAGPSVIGAEKSKPAAAAPKSGPKAAATVDGKVIFSDNCSSCHTLAAAGASGSVGPNLDDLKPSVDTVSTTVKNGSGAMPSFGGDLSDQEIAAVADFVASSAQ